MVGLGNDGKRWLDEFDFQSKSQLPGSSSRDLVKGPIFVTFSGLKT